MTTLESPQAPLQVGKRLFDVDPAEVGRAVLERNGAMHLEDAMVIFGLLLTLISLISVVGWLARQRLQPHALLVFHRVAAEAGLSLRDRLLLQRIARHARLPTPLALLLCPGTLGHAARAHARAQRHRPATLALARAASIRRHVFG